MRKPSAKYQVFMTIESIINVLQPIKTHGNSDFNFLVSLMHTHSSLMNKESFFTIMRRSNRVGVNQNQYSPIGFMVDLIMSDRI